ncbi:Semaphorin-4B [Oryzias melastigma]|uniref:Semaphorin-4B n=1 Tax=Oryzias melastigma TaxID=30732 RepID=A0A834KZH2_ORYME|nr:Semaphorin-4B [Oryzias melastigma]
MGDSRLCSFSPTQAAPMDTSSLLSLTVVLLGLLGPCLTRLTPRVSFPMGSPGRRLTSFNIHEVKNTTTLLLAPDEETLYVGAQDALLELDVSQKDAITLRNKNLQTFTMQQNFDEGRGRCPYDPYQRNTAVIVDGELYTGTVADYRGNRPIISRHLSEGKRLDLKLDDTLGWLEDPTFISSIFIPHEEKIYFFFSEAGREYDFINKFIVSRVSQICVSDVGGQRTLQRRWTTFAKAQLLCQAGSELPYNVLQDISILPPAEGAPADDTLFYGIFTSQWPVNSGRSAVCSFRLADIKAVFSGNYKVLNRDTLQWSARVQEKVANPGECGLHNASDNALRFVKENFLAEDSVRPVARSLTMVSAEHIYSRLSVQRVQAVNRKYYTMLFLLTEAGQLHKAVLLRGGAHIIEEVQVFQHPQAVKSLKLSIPKGVIYVGTSEGLVKLPVSNCSFYWTCAQCVLSRDPFCAWDPVGRACVGTSEAQNPLNQDVDGGNVEEACSSALLTHRTRFGSSKLHTGSCPAGELVSVSLNEVVRLNCPAASQLSQQQWERPNSRLSSNLYLQLRDGSLSFVATPTTLGHYLCLSTENGYRQTMAIYHVKQKSSQAPTGYTHQTPVTQPAYSPGPNSSTGQATDSGQKDDSPSLSVQSIPSSSTHRARNKTVWTEESQWRGVKLHDGELLVSSRSPCYLKELVVVSILLVLCLSLLITISLYFIRQRCHCKTIPQPQPPSRDAGRVTPEEVEPMGSKTLGKSNSEVARSGNARGFACNGISTGSDGHLPNTPI